MKKGVITWISLAIGLSLASASSYSAPVLPDFNSATFVAGTPVDNPFFPLTDRGTRTYVAEKEENGETVTERFELTNLGSGPTILGVQTTTQRDRSFEDDLIVEDTFDYYAQDTEGNVWYFGEDVTNFIYDDDDNLVETTSESAWRAGENGALPGYIMPADRTVGFNYYQEFAPADEALDQGETFATGQQVSIGIGDFTNVLQVLETTELAPDDREFKYYAPGQGLILAEEGLDADLQNPELTFELVSEIPEPATIALMGFGIAGILAYRHPCRRMRPQR